MPSWLKEAVMIDPDVHTFEILPDLAEELDFHVRRVSMELLQMAEFALVLGTAIGIAWGTAAVVRHMISKSK